MKPRLLLLHGVARTGQSWAAHRPLLEETFDVVTPDLPGFGDAPGPFRLDSAVAGIADALDDATDAGGVRTTIVCGHSAGAMVALRLAARRPERVAGLVLSGVQVRAPRMLVAVQSVMMRAIPAARFDDSGVTKAGLLDAVGELGRADLRPDLAAVRARTLVVCGERDRFNLRAARRAVAGIGGAELHLQPGGDHLWSESEPAAFSELLVTWACRTGLA